jgi:hypothetical protein
MTRLLIVVFVLNLSGCAAYFDWRDPCQRYGKPEGHQFPSFCGAASGKTFYVRDFRTGNITQTIRSY